MHRFLVMLSVAAFAGVASAQRPDTGRILITATGQADIRIIPTSAVINLLIEATAPTSGEAMTRGAQSSNSVLDTLRRAGGAEDLSLVQYGVVPTPNFGSPQGGPPNTFTSRAAVRFVASLSRVPALTAAAYARGASGSAAPQFRHEGLTETLSRAFEEAAANARQRAEAIARGLGGRLGMLTGISHHQVYPMEYPGVQQFPSQPYEQQTRPLPDIRQTVQVSGTWVFVPG